MGDRELLELAAKAVGIPIGIAEGEWSYRERGFDGVGLYENNIGRGLFWNPLRDDSEALRLAVKRGIAIYPPEADGDDATTHVDGVESNWISEPVDNDPHAATRRAIVRAAAALAGQGTQASA
jgi:hypothetical protein